MSGDEVEVQLTHILCQLRAGELGLVEVLEAGIANRVGALDARVAAESRRHRRREIHLRLGGSWW